jgi:hypothetical protein
MPSDDFIRFRAIVDADDALQDELWLAPDVPALAALVVRRAAERGLHVRDADVRTACADGLTTWLTIQNF